MTDSHHVDQPNSDETADAYAATIVIALVVGAIVFWLSGMPS